MINMIVNAVCPVVALIGAGYLSGRRQLLGVGALDALNLYVVWLALPAMLFLVMAHLTGKDLSHLPFVLSFLGAQMLPFLAIYFWARRAGRGIGQATVDSLTGSYANTSYMGIPVLMAVLGPRSMMPMAIATVMTVGIQFAGSILLMEKERALKGGALLSRWRLIWTVLCNPLVASPLAGGAFALAGNIGGFYLPQMAETTLTMLGNSSSPCALVVIGLFLASRQGDAASARSGDGLLLAVLTFIKLILQPLIAFVLAFWVFRADPLWARACVLLAATPNGTGAFMLARLYDREAGMISRAILISTILSAVTLPLFILLLS
ncbi:Transporter [Granulibacter bethesdensis]|uniref:Transporter n=2 Tax=Granulibacter bethesdensis TaxID=364410 RepID=A0AAN0VFA8_9PROT|nr:Transporter [Granulibacter bethesdensis]